MNHDLISEKVTNYWQGDNLVKTWEHIKHYINTKDSKYFSDNLYIPFSTLIHYNFLRIYKQSNIELYDDIANECFINIHEVIFDKYDIARNPYSYFNQVINWKIKALFRRFLTHNKVITDMETLDEVGLNKIMFDVYNDNCNEPRNDYTNINAGKVSMGRNSWSNSKIHTYKKFISRLLASEIEIPTNITNMVDVYDFVRTHCNWKTMHDSHVSTIIKEFRGQCRNYNPSPVVKIPSFEYTKQFFPDKNKPTTTIYKSGKQRKQNAKLTLEQVKEIKGDTTSLLSDLAKKYNCSDSMISYIRKGKRYKNL